MVVQCRLLLFLRPFVQKLYTSESDAPPGKAGFCTPQDRPRSRLLSYALATGVARAGDPSRLCKRLESPLQATRVALARDWSRLRKRLESPSLATGVAPARNPHQEGRAPARPPAAPERVPPPFVRWCSAKPRMGRHIYSRGWSMRSMRNPRYRRKSESNPEGVAQWVFRWRRNNCATPSGFVRSSNAFRGLRARCALHPRLYMCRPFGALRACDGVAQSPEWGFFRSRDGVAQSPEWGFSRSRGGVAQSPEWGDT